SRARARARPSRPATSSGRAPRGSPRSRPCRARPPAPRGRAASSAAGPRRPRAPGRRRRGADRARLAGHRPRAPARPAARGPHAAAASGRRVLAVEVSRGSLGSLLGGLHLGAEPTRVRAGLAAASLEPEALLGDFVGGVLRFRVLARRLLESTSFQVLAAAAPGLGEFLVLHRLLGWVEARRGRRPVHDLVIVDAPASGLSFPLLAAPHTLGVLA